MHADPGRELFGLSFRPPRPPVQGGGNPGAGDGVEPFPVDSRIGVRPSQLSALSNDFTGALMGCPTSKPVTVTYAINSGRHHGASAGGT